MTIYVHHDDPLRQRAAAHRFALELVQADALARYHRLAGARVRFQTGTDDNALSNVLSARAQGIPVENLVDTNSGAFRSLVAALDISADNFVRTSAPSHHAGVRHFLSSLRPHDIYVAPYSGLYCPRCEDFYLEKDVKGGCPEHGIPLDEVEETNHFFRLSRYQEAVRDLISTRAIEIVPESRELEVLRFIDRGLHDFSISRSAARASGWGVPFPGDPDQVVYVWVDALINYLTGGRLSRPRRVRRILERRSPEDPRDRQERLEVPRRLLAGAAALGRAAAARSDPRPRLPDRGWPEDQQVGGHGERSGGGDRGGWRGRRPLRVAGALPSLPGHGFLAGAPRGRLSRRPRQRPG